MERADIQTFWKFLAYAKVTGKPSSLTEDEVRQMGRKAELFEHEIETLLRGLRKVQNKKGSNITSGPIIGRSDAKHGE
jgi:hypothetical protein